MLKTSVAVITVAIIAARMEAAAQQISSGNVYGVTVVAEDEILLDVRISEKDDVLSALAAQYGLVVHKPELEWYVTVNGGDQW